jgi:hypothetical protein
MGSAAINLADLRFGACSAQRLRERAAAGGVAFLRRVEKGHAATPHRLGAVERRDCKAHLFVQLARGKGKEGKAAGAS